MNELCLDYLTAVEADPSRLARIAAANDVRLVTFKVSGNDPSMPGFQLVHDRALQRTVKADCEALGVSVDMLESFEVGPGTDLQAFRTAFEMAAFIGAPKINVLLRRDDEPARLSENFAGLCVLAAEYGLEVMLEVARVMAVRRPTDAAEFLKREGQPNARMLIDTRHFFRFHGAPEAAAAVAPWVGRVQLCDGPPEMPGDRQLWEAVHERQPPGEGSFPLREFLAGMPDGITIGLEVPMESEQLAGASAEDRSARVIAAARRVMA